MCFLAAFQSLLIKQTALWLPSRAIAAFSCPLALGKCFFKGKRLSLLPSGVCCPFFPWLASSSKLKRLYYQVTTYQISLETLNESTLKDKYTICPKKRKVKRLAIIISKKIRSIIMYIVQIICRERKFVLRLKFLNDDRLYIYLYLT